MTRKDQIKQLLLETLCRNGELTRTGFVRDTGLRAASVFEAVAALKAEKLLLEPGRTSQKTGRKSPKLKLNPDYAFYAGIELQLSRALGLVIDNSGNVIARTELPVAVPPSRDKALNALEQVFCRLRSAVGEDWKKVKGVGFADPGLVDSSRGLSLSAVNLPGWTNIDMGRNLRILSGADTALALPETAAHTFAEYHSRLPEPPASILLVNMGTGIGSGFIKRGELFFGDTFRGMELGHIMIVPDGPLCQCGNRGCLEAVAGEAGIRRKIAELINNGVDTELSLEDFSLARFVAAAKRDRVAMMLANEICQSISLALSTAVALLNPSMIVLSGELAGLGGILIDTVRRSLTMHCFPGAVSKLAVEISSLDDFAAARAAAILIRNKVILKN